MIVLFGLIIGSFLTTLIYRSPIYLKYKYKINNTNHKITSFKAILLTRSFCPHCQRKIHFFDNIPLLGFLIQKGKCRFCHDKISLTYPLVEIAISFLFIFIFFSFGFNQLSIILCIFISFLFCLSIIDIRDQFLPDYLTLSLLILGLVFNYFGFLISFREAILGSIIGFLFLWLTGKIYYLKSKQYGLGLGDVKLFAAIGAWLGLNALLPVILLASFLAILFFILFYLYHFLFKQTKKHLFKTAIAFGPFLSIVTNQK